jgi:hypothetical protein
MAGSWGHITDGSGRLNLDAGLIENLGDAAEALEQCYDMVQRLADRLAAILGADRSSLITEAEEYHYQIHRGEVPQPAWHEQEG